MLMEPNGIGVCPDELIYGHPLDHGWSLHALLLSPNEDRHVFRLASLLLSLLRGGQLTLPLRHHFALRARSLSLNLSCSTPDFEPYAPRDPQPLSGTASFPLRAARMAGRLHLIASMSPDDHSCQE